MTLSVFDENPHLRVLTQKLMQARVQEDLYLQAGDTGEASAPSNIALLKYWGKQPGARQVPVNSSVSLTLGGFRAFTRVSVLGRFFPLLQLQNHVSGIRPPFVFELNGRQEAMPEKMQRLLVQMLEPFAPEVSFFVQSRNNFPTACGVASSAAGYAALVAAVADALNLSRFFSDQELDLWLTEWARLGSGSATRSALIQRRDTLRNDPQKESFSAFVAWQRNVENEDLKNEDLSSKTVTFACDIHPRFLRLRHCLLVLDAREKETGSSEGHLIAQTSPLMQIRLAQYPHRFCKMLNALKTGDFDTMAHLSELDAFEMHAVMGTGQTPLHYMTEHTALAIRILMEQRLCDQSAVFWTLDAGANPHFIFESSASASLGRVLRTLSSHDAFSNARVLIDGQKGPAGVVFERSCPGSHPDQISRSDFDLLSAAEILAK